MYIYVLYSQTKIKFLINLELTKQNTIQNVYEDSCALCVKQNIA